jgi:hypothetical protein
MIVLASGQSIDPDQIETHYRRSSFVKEICVMAIPDAARADTQRLCAVVVPDMDRLRAKKIVNVGDIIRFEMEGLTASLPQDQRVLGYDIWFEPLPRTTGAAIDRDQIQRRTRQRSETRLAGDEAPISDADRQWMTGPRPAARRNPRAIGCGQYRSSRCKPRDRSGFRLDGSRRTAD